MKTWKRYVLVLVITSVLTTFLTFLVYKHVKLKFASKKHIYDPANLQMELLYNGNPSAKFYDLYDKSPLYDALGDLDRRAINGRTLTSFLQRQDVTALQRKHNLNVGLSDLLPLNRPIPDSRPDGYVSHVS